MKARGDAADRGLAQFVDAWTDWAGNVSFASVTRGARKLPLAGLDRGAAGIAYALWHVAVARRDDAILRHAQRWLRLAYRAAGVPRASGPRPGERWRIDRSLMRGRAGLLAVDALVAHASGRPRNRDAALIAFASATIARRRPLAEFFVGDAGALVAALQLRAYTGGDLSTVIDTLGPRLHASARLSDLAFAHGNAGVQFALVAWARATRAPTPRVDRPDIPKIRARASSAMALSWCNGLAGFVQLWVAAYEHTGEPIWMEAARGAAGELERAGDDAYNGGSLCCGLGGRAYALLGLSRIDARGGWRAKARALALAALGDTALGPTLFRGMAGMACLAVDLTGDGSHPPMHGA